MKGKIIDYSVAKNAGIISGEDGKRYIFQTHEWHESGYPARGLDVDFEVDKQTGRAISVYPLNTGFILQNTQDAPAQDLPIYAYFFYNLRHRYFDFKGRSTARDFWSFHLAYFVICLGFLLMDVLMGLFAKSFYPDSPLRTLFNAGSWVIGILMMIYFFLMLIPSVALGVRRLHDIGKSVWWYGLTLIPLVGWAVLVYMLCQPSEKDENEWGEPIV